MATLKDPFDRQTVSWLLGETISVPVRVREDGRVEFYYGGALPKTEDGTIGMLQVPKRSITDHEMIRRLKEDRIELFLEPRSIVMFAINGKDTPEKLKKYLRHARTVGINVPNVVHVVQVELGESPLNLRISGANRARLQPVECWIPALKTNAKSLNHAYRLVSEQFEPKRISHTGNVFEVGYFEREEDWISLEYHRDSMKDRYDIWRNIRSNS